MSEALREHIKDLIFENINCSSCKSTRTLLGLEEATQAILTAFEESLLEEIEIRMYDGAPKYPEQESWNACLEAIKSKLREKNE